MTATTLSAPFEATTMDIPAESFDISKHNGLITISNPATGQHRTFNGTCRRCNRTLTVPESLSDGYGPECRRKVAEGL